MDRILMEGMGFFGRHGVFPAERELGARFSVDVLLEGDLRAPGRSDRLEETIDYARAYEVVREVVEGEPRHLLEAVAESVAGRLLALPRVERVTVRVHKKPPLPGEFRSVSVEITRP
ncbi:MAG TPA: dihydroneopterin aldolase [Candidatus Dormibacteraeota bacterium]|nr:dihydroneopterin aldolase [Candidatus Dormibacteraeota bacterium]